MSLLIFCYIFVRISFFFMHFCEAAPFPMPDYYKAITSFSFSFCFRYYKKLSPIKTAFCPAGHLPGCKLRFLPGRAVYKKCFDEINLKNSQNILSKDCFGCFHHCCLALFFRCFPIFRYFPLFFVIFCYFPFWRQPTESFFVIFSTKP